MVCPGNSPEADFFCYTDGASRGNPGPSAYAFIVIKEDTILHKGSGFIGISTNNVAEYMAVIHGLKWLTEITRGIIHVRSDSELVIRQLSGTYAVRKPHLAELYHDVSMLSKRFTSVTYHSVPRENDYIMQADLLCNHELDRLRT
jgi:ribonuclease HI